MGTAVVRAIFRPWNDACVSDIVLPGVILPPEYLNVCVGLCVFLARAREREAKKRNIRWIDQIFSDVAHVVVKGSNCNNGVG